MSDGSVIVIGNFDGVHKGHVALIKSARDAEPGAKLIAVTFWPHPWVIHHPEQVPALLTTLDRRIELLRAAGVDEVIVVDYTPELARQTPAEFVDGTLRPLDPVRIVVGENFRFGLDNSGDARTLGDLAGGDFKVQVQPLLGDSTEPNSATLIRKAIAAGDIERARQLSDQVFRITGIVVEGDHRGREMGFPTANLPVDATAAVPADGVYAGWVTRLDIPAPRWPAAISVGTNPTFDGLERRVEAYVLDRTDLELYGVEIAIDFHTRIRGQVKFEGMESLIKQMHGDVDQIRKLLSDL